MARDQRDRVGLDLDRLGRRRRASTTVAICSTVGRAEVEAVAAVDDRRQHLLRLGRREHEDRVRRRLLERLEERVPRLRGEHVRLVEDVDLVAARRPARRRRFSRRSRMSSTELLEAASISITSSEVALAIATHDSQHAARLDRRPVLAVQAGGEDLGHRRLAGPARADEQVGVVDLAPARRRCAACARRAPGRRRRRTCAGGGGGTARGRRTRTTESSGRGRTVWPGAAFSAGARRSAPGVGSPPAPAAPRGQGIEGVNLRRFVAFVVSRVAGWLGCSGGGLPNGWHTDLW